MLIPFYLVVGILDRLFHRCQAVLVLLIESIQKFKLTGPWSFLSKKDTQSWIFPRMEAVMAVMKIVWLRP